MIPTPVIVMGIIWVFITMGMLWLLEAGTRPPGEE